MKKTQIVIAVIALALGACSTLTPQQQQVITTTEKLVALAGQIGGTYEAATGNNKVANDLYAVGAVAAAYGNAPVPTNVIQATVLVPEVATIVTPLLVKNGPKSQAILNAAAGLVQALPPAPAATPAPSPASP